MMVLSILDADLTLFCGQVKHCSDNFTEIGIHFKFHWTV